MRVNDPLCRYCAACFLLWFLLCVLCAPAAWAQLPGAAPPVGADTTAARPRLAAADTVAYEVLERRLRAAFSRIPAFEDVQVDVADGVVTLSGNVLRAGAREQAEELAYRFREVLYVQNDLEAETDVEERVSPALERVRDWGRTMLDYLPLLGVALALLLLFGFLARLVGRWDAPFDRFDVDPLLRELIQQVVGLVLILVGVVLALEVMDVTAVVGAILGAAGIVGIALGFAFQDIVENYLAGVLLSLRRPFELNDYVSVDTHEGRVLRLTARELVLMTLDGNHVRIPNATVFKSVVANFTRNPRRRFDFAVGVGTVEDLARVQRLGRRALEAMKGVMDDPPPFAFVEVLGDWNVVVRFYGWVDQREADFFKVRSEAVRIVKAALDEAGVAMPEPTYRVWMQQAEAPATAAATVDTPGPGVEAAARAVDVGPDPQLDGQIREDLERSDEDNLLKKPRG